MAAKKEDSKSDIKDFIMKIISSKVAENIKDHLNDFMKSVQEKIYHTEKIILQKLFATVILSLGSVFLLLSAVFYLKEYQQWTNTQSFLLIGLVLVILAFAMKYFIMKNEFKK